MKCNRCNDEHDGSFGSGKFCSRSCANSRPMTEERQAKISAGVKLAVLNGNVRPPASPSEIEETIQKVKATWNEKLLNDDFNSMGISRQRKRVILDQDGKCNRCKIDKWLDEPLTLELEHKNGIHSDNERSNLEALCPNCHSLTTTWRGRNNRVGRIPTTDEQRVTAFLKTGSIHKALVSLNLAPKGANYTRMKQALTRFNVEY